MNAHAAKASPLKIARDFYSELMKDTQAKSAAYLAERERWLRSVNVDGREELLFELEMILRGVERYFNLHNLPIDAQEPVVGRDFREELLDVKDALEHAIRLARQLLDPDSDQKMVFRKYVESQLADDRARRELLEDALDQDSPQESLFLLRQGFDAVRTVIDHLTQLPSCPFPLYTDIGNLLLREVVLNRYFRPFRPLEFRIEYDRIKSVPILQALTQQPDRDRRLFTVAFLSLFRGLHHLSYAGLETEEAPPRRTRVVLALVRSELVSLVGYLKTELAAKAGKKRHQGAALKAARELTRESARIAKKLAEAANAGPALQVAAVEFTELVRKQIVLLAGVLDPELAGASFSQLVSRSEMARRLRRDLWVFSALCREAESALKTNLELSEVALATLRRYLTFFHEVSYQLLRYGDYEAVDRFAALLLEIEHAPPGPVARQRLAEDCRMFSAVAETTFAAVNRRSTLAGKSFDLAEAESLLVSFAPALG